MVFPVPPCCPPKKIQGGARKEGGDFFLQRHAIFWSCKRNSIMKTNEMSEDKSQMKRMQTIANLHVQLGPFFHTSQATETSCFKKKKFQPGEVCALLSQLGGGNWGQHVHHQGLQLL